MLSDGKTITRSEFTQCHSVSSKLVNCKQTQLIKSQQQHMKDVSETLDWNLWPGAERLHRMCFWDTGSESMIRTQHFLSTHQICNLIFFPLSSTVLILKSTPTVDLHASQKVSSVNLSIRLVFPTPREPMMITCSLKSATLGSIFLRRCDAPTAGEPPPALRWTPNPESILH